LAHILHANEARQAAASEMEAGTRVAPTNEEVASVLETLASLYEARGSSGFRVRAYRAAAETVRGERRSVTGIARERGEAGLCELPAIGRSIASTILEFVAERSPAAANVASPRARHERGRTLRAAHAIVGARAVHRGAPIALLLEIDAEYRKLAAEGGLPTIAPRHFNPDDEAWLPVMYAERDGWSFTAMFSNTARAHHFAKTYDWVVLHYARGGREKQCTVVTEWHGDLVGLRVVRGHEQACRRYYAHHARKAAA